MSKTVFKYFFDPIDHQEKWLNKMASEGFRLVGTTKCTYKFEGCKLDEYEYRVEFVGDKSEGELMKYIDFLDEMGYHSFIKNTNINYSIGKVRWRPWAGSRGRFATSPGNINKEFLIIEKVKDGNIFEMHTDTYDIITYYKRIRNSYAWVSIAIILLLIFGTISSSFSELLRILIRTCIGALSLFFIIVVIRYSALIHSYKEKQKTNE